MGPHFDVSKSDTSECNLDDISKTKHTPPSDSRPRVSGKAPEDYKSHLEKLEKVGQSRRSDQDQPNLSNRPTWFNEAQFNNAKSVYKRHFMSVNFSHLSGLLLLIRLNSIYSTLSSTGKSNSVKDLFRRYLHTVCHVKSWYEGDIFERGSKAHTSLLLVRGMHNKTSSNLNNQIVTDPKGSSSIPSSTKSIDSSQGESQTSNNGTNQTSIKVHVSEYDILITQFAFVGLIVIESKKMGLIDDFNQYDLESLLHFWRVIGHYLGVKDDFNLCSYNYEDIVGLSRAIADEFKNSMATNGLNSSPHGTMCVNIVRSVKFVPMLTVYGMLKHIYFVIGYDDAEVEQRKGYYSTVSHYLINLVMTRLLAFKAFRAFNNSLLRLSFYIVGKIEDWYARRLESKFGLELKS